MSFSKSILSAEQVANMLLSAAGVVSPGTVVSPEMAELAAVEETPEELFGIREKEDKEYEWSDGMGWDGARYFTCSGNMSGEGYVERATRLRSAGGWSDARPDYVPSFYSAARNWRQQERNLHLVLGWISRHKTNRAVLQTGWKKFWVRYYAAKEAGTLSDWLFQKHITLIRAEFGKYGVGRTSK